LRTPKAKTKKTKESFIIDTAGKKKIRNRIGRIGERLEDKEKETEGWDRGSFQSAD